MYGTLNPWPNILLTTLDANPVVAPKANPGRMCLVARGISLLKRALNKEQPFLITFLICVLDILIFTPFCVLIAFLILLICVFVSISSSGPCN